MQVTSAYTFSKKFALKPVLSKYFPPRECFSEHMVLETIPTKRDIACSRSYNWPLRVRVRCG